MACPMQQVKLHQEKGTGGARYTRKACKHCNKKGFHGCLRGQTTRAPWECVQHCSSTCLECHHGIHVLHKRRIFPGHSSSFAWGKIKCTALSGVPLCFVQCIWLRRAQRALWNVVSSRSAAFPIGPIGGFCDPLAQRVSRYATIDNVGENDAICPIVFLTTAIGFNQCDFGKINQIQHIPVLCALDMQECVPTWMPINLLHCGAMHRLR